jgi:hypothetical protein
MDTSEIFVIFILPYHLLKEVEHEIGITIVQEHIIRTLLYYDIFNYPLTVDEIKRYSGADPADLEQVPQELEQLLNAKQVFKFGEFYTVQNNVANVDRRIKGNEEAARYLTIAKKKAQFISKFPFVRAVFGSGSLSKGYMDEHSDLDFFIITKPGRLWVARTLLVMYKRIFLLNSHKHFCVNYFVDHDHLEIEEKNLFTATELATVIPLVGGEYYHKLHAANAWLPQFFPNYTKRPTQEVPRTKTSILTRGVETFINLLGGKLLEERFMRMTIRRWQKMYGGAYGSDDFKIAFKSKKYASKNHPKHYQKKVTTLYTDKINAFNHKFNLSLKP